METNVESKRMESITRKCGFPFDIDVSVEGSKGVYVLHAQVMFQRNYDNFPLILLLLILLIIMRLGLGGQWLTKCKWKRIMLEFIKRSN